MIMIKKLENILGNTLAIIIVSMIIFSVGYTIIKNGIFSVGSQDRYFDYQEE